MYPSVKILSIIMYVLKSELYTYYYINQMSLLRIILGTSNPDVRIALQYISINPTVSATIKYQLVSNTEGIKDCEITIDGQQYSAWGADDTIVYHIICARHNLQFVPYVEPEFYEEAFVYKNDVGEIVSELIRKPNPNYVRPVSLPASETAPAPETASEPAPAPAPAPATETAP
jgi:hypothetical protein